VFDVPLLPPQIAGLQTFLSLAQVAYHAVQDSIAYWRGANMHPGAWVLVNACGVYDLRQDPAPGTILNNGENRNHPIVRELGLANGNNLDVIFAAGNCGQFCPSIRCGARNRGPGRSIHGVNAHPDVLTVAAVRTDTVWLGYSAEGPGPAALTTDKPDIVAPSQFAEAGNASPAGSNIGTSAACGMAAGAVALLRTVSDPAIMSPAALRSILRETASAPPRPAPVSRFGEGIVEVAAALPLI
jgi:hypothetical protein